MNLNISNSENLSIKTINKYLNSYAFPNII